MDHKVRILLRLAHLSTLTPNDSSRSPLTYLQQANHFASSLSPTSLLSLKIKIQVLECMRKQKDQNPEEMIQWGLNALHTVSGQKELSLDRLRLLHQLRVSFMSFLSLS
jgi:hypothetical protein